ncbi:hypothetical protein LSUE1_G010312, partial [Lachnellula suecica]
MDLRGQRFTVDLSDDEDETGLSSRIPQNAIPSLTSAFIGDIKERSTAPPSAPKLKTTATGFPEHKKRTKVSAFKQQRAKSATPANGDSPNAFGVPPPRPMTGTNNVTTDTTFDEDERRRIDEQNKQRLDMMSAEEINEERQELLAGLNPSLIERLLKRANLDEGRGDTGIEPPSENTNKKTGKPIEFEVDKDAVPAPVATGKPAAAPKSVRFEEDEEPKEPIVLQPVSDEPLSNMEPAVHFPT